MADNIAAVIGNTPGGGTLLPSFQSMLNEALKAEGLIPMTTGVTRPLPTATDYNLVLNEAGLAVERASVQFGGRATDRYSTEAGSSYRDQRFAMIASLENVRTKAYNDTGRVAVGLGFNMDKPGARTVWNQAFGNSVDFDRVRSGDQSITRAQAKQLFDHDIVYFENVVSQAAGNRPLTQNQRLALVSVAYSTPSRVAGWSKTIQSGDDAALMDLILTNSFRENHPQASGLQKRRFIEASIFAGTAEAKDLMPSFNEYIQAVKVDPKTGVASVNGQPVKPGEPALVHLDQNVGGSTRQGVAIPIASFDYDYSSGTKRDLPVKDELLQNIQRSVTAVYGGDYRVSVISGTQNPGKAKASDSGRHEHGAAADVYVYAPNGKRLTPDQLVPLAQHWTASNIGSVGFPANGQSMHLDLIGGKGPGAVPLGKGQGKVWYYGTPTAAQRAAINAGIAGTRPTYMLDPDAVEKGLVPPGSLNNTTHRPGIAPTPAKQSDALKALRDATPPTNGAPTPAKPSIGLKTERALNKPVNGAPTPAIQSNDMKLLRNPEMSEAARRAQVNRLPDITGTGAPYPATMSESIKLARMTVAKRPGTAPVPQQRPAATVKAAQQIGVQQGVYLNGVGTMGVSGTAPKKVVASARPPLEIVVEGAKTIQASPTQIVKAATGMTSAQAYAALNSAARSGDRQAWATQDRTRDSDGGASSLVG